MRKLIMSGHNLNPVAFGQLQGMADDVSCELLQQQDRARNVDGLSDADAEIQKQAAPRAYKCLAWGSVPECMNFLMRRAVENANAAERVKDGLPDIRAELKRRIFSWT